ncbi:MAG: hypothetical protein QXP52_00220 [Candidatus Aenigmatarchaeota archaeon]
MKIKVSKGYTVPTIYKYTTYSKYIEIEKEFPDNENFEKCLSEVEELVNRGLRFIQPPKFEFTHEERNIALQEEKKKIEVLKKEDVYTTINKCEICNKESNIMFFVAFDKKTYKLCVECFNRLKSFSEIMDFEIIE